MIYVLFSICMFLLVVIGLQWLHIRDKRREHLNYEQKTMEILFEAHQKKFKAQSQIIDMQSEIDMVRSEREAANEVCYEQATKIHELKHTIEALEAGKDELQEGLEQDILSYHDQLEAKTNIIKFYEQVARDLGEVALFHDDHCLPYYSRV